MGFEAAVATLGILVFIATLVIVWVWCENRCLPGECHFVPVNGGMDKLCRYCGRFMRTRKLKTKKGVVHWFSDKTFFSCCGRSDNPSMAQYRDPLRFTNRVWEVTCTGCLHSVEYQKALDAAVEASNGES